MTNLDDDELGRNWLWLAADRSGYLALFQSIGDGALPRSLRSSLEDAELVDDFILTHLKSTIECCVGHVLSEGREYITFERMAVVEKYKKEYDSYLAGVQQRASCGLFVFDAHLQTHRPVGYFQIGYPSIPRTVETLPLNIQSIVQHAVLDVKFSETHYIPVDTIEGVVGA
ncbi:MAG: hypothetical protein K8T25_15880 [Planctomycetia bacterium]|nr:hypothetical protein [Planctomycetia bacterium]